MLQFTKCWGCAGPNTGSWWVGRCLGWDLEKEPSRLCRGARKGLSGGGGRGRAMGRLAERGRLRRVFLALFLSIMGSPGV